MPRTLLVLVRARRHRRRKIRYGNFLHRHLSGLEKAELTYATASGVYDPGDSWHQEVIRLPAHRLPAHRIVHGTVLAALAQADFPLQGTYLAGRGLRQTPELYFLNLERALIFHMYDDRGLDLMAGDRQTLRPLYEQFNAWLLDYDRDRMDQMFS